jgi:hypothetical protein
MFISFLFDQTGCPLAGGRARVKLQIVKGMWNGFDFYYFYLDRIIRIIRIFFACGERPYGRRPHYPDDPACRGIAERRLVDPVQLYSFNIRIHSYFCLILKVSIFDQTGRFSGQRRR